MNVSIRAVLALLFSVVFPCAVSFATVDSEDSNALTAVTHDLCHRQVAMLGESATHGDGHTVAFKVALVQRLVNECGFDSVFFEASHYEFLHVAEQLRMGHAVSVDQVSSAIGGLWKFDREFQPLVPFLLAKAQAGKISLGGIDDQLGQLGQDYANVEMINELTTSLPQQERQTCGLALHRRIYSDYTEAAPYSKLDRSQIAHCLSNMERSVAADRTINLPAREEREEIISTMQRWISRDFTSDEASVVERDRSMFQNFKWLRRRQPNRRKVILWAATVHIAKRGDPSWRITRVLTSVRMCIRSTARRLFLLDFQHLLVLTDRDATLTNCLQRLSIR